MRGHLKGCPLFVCLLRRSGRRHSNASLEIFPAEKFHTFRLCYTCVPHLQSGQRGLNFLYCKRQYYGITMCSHR